MAYLTRHLVTSLRVSLGGKTILEHELKHAVTSLIEPIYSPAKLCLHLSARLSSVHQEHMGSERQYLPPLQQALGVARITSLKQQHLELG